LNVLFYCAIINIIERTTNRPIQSYYQKGKNNQNAFTNRKWRSVC